MAQVCGRPVEILSERTEFSQTFANADGSRTLQQSAEPQRVRQNGSWVPIDTTLKRTSTGVTPKASVLPMTFSGGGDTLVGRLVNGSREITLTWPTVLPKPQLKGDTAIYPNVLPDVDLQVTASATGFSEVLVVKTREAAANPNVAALEFGLDSKGVTVAKTAGGGLSAHDSSGTEVFAVPAPLMWDSSKSVEEQVKVPTEEKPDELGASGEETQRDRARQAVMPIKLGKNSLTLTPDKAMLTDPRTEFPVYIDPYVSGALSGGSWTSVWSKYPTKSFWKNTTALTDSSITGAAGVGRTEDCVGCADHIIRSFFRMDTSGVKGDVISAGFAIEQRWSWTCNPKSDAKVWRTGEISAATTWQKQPSFSSKTAQAAANRKYGSVHGCIGSGPVEFNVTNMVTDADNTVTIGMKAIDESTKNQWKRYNPSTARLSVTYNQKPNALKAQQTHTSKSCVTGANRPYVTTTTGVQLSGNQSDPDGAQKLTTYFYWWPTTVAPNTSNVRYQSADNPAAVTATLPTLVDGTTYAWRARTVDNVPAAYQMESWSEKTCEFTVDATPPPAPGGLSSTDYSATQPSGGVGYQGIFKIAAPVLPGLTEAQALARKKDIFSYGWTLDGGKKVSTGTVPVNADFTGSIPLTPWTDGEKKLRVWSKDKAGHSSAEISYTFTVLHGSGPAASWEFDDTTAETTADVAEHGNKLTLTGATRVAGRGNDGSALSLNGTSARSGITTGPVTYPNASTRAAVAVKTDANFTVSARVKLSTTTGVTGQQIAVAAGGTTTSAYTLGYDGPTNRWRFTMAGSDVAAPATVSASSNAAPTANKWTHLAGTYDAAAKKLTLYVNGVAQSATATLTGGFNATGAVTVGQRRWNGSYDSFFKGELDDVRIYSTIAKTDALIKDAMPLQPAISVANRTEISAGGTLKVTFDAEGDTNVSKFRYSFGADGLGSTAIAVNASGVATPGGTAAVDVPVGTIKGERKLYFAAEDALRIGPMDQRIIEVISKASLFGPVTDTSGLPLVGATVTLQPGNYSATTDVNGLYVFPEVEVNNYTVRATYDGRCGFAGSQTFLVDEYGKHLRVEIPRVADRTGHRCAERTVTYIPGTTVLPLTGDDAATKIGLPFAFPFYGSAHLEVCVDTNGLLSFNPPCVSHPYTAGDQLGAVAEPNGVIAPFWDDLVVDGSANVRTTVTGTGTTKAMVIEWNNVHRKGNTAQRLSFSVTLGIDGTITTNYNGLDNATEQGSSALVGIEAPSGEDSLPYSVKEASLTNGKAIVFTNSTADPLEVHNLTGKLTTATGTAAAGATVTLDPSGLTATTATDGTYAFYGLAADSYTVSSKQAGRCGNKAEAVVDLSANTVRDLQFGPDYGLMGYACTVGASGYVAADTNTWLTGDDAETAVHLPFAMSFYGRSSDYATVSTNGWVGIGGGYLTPLWGDLTIDSQSSVLTKTIGTAPNRSYVIEWRNALFNGTSDRTTFEAILHENGRVAYHYGAMSSDVQKGSTSTVGMVSTSFRTTAYYSNWEPALTANSSITYTPAAAGTVGGVLTAAVSAQPLPGTTITLNPSGQTTTTGPDGSYQFTNVAPGAYYVLASADGDRCLGQYASAEVYKTSGDAKRDLSLNNDADPYYNCTVTTQPFIAGDTVQSRWTGDDAAWQTTAPFPIKLYGESTTTPWISSNGFLTFGPEGATSPDRTAIPAAAEDGTPNTAFYPFWHDWVVDGSAAIVTKTSGTAPNRQWVVEWRNVSSYGNDAVRTSFEIIFGEDGSATYAYDRIDDNPVERGAEGTVGIESPGGVVGFQYLYSADLLTNGLGVHYAVKAPETNYVNGTVTCASQPVDGAVVTVAGQTAVTDAGGYFIGDVPTKTQTVAVTIGSGDCAGTTTRTALVGQPEQPVDIALQPTPAGTGYTVTETETAYAPLAAEAHLTRGYGTRSTVELPFPVTVYGQVSTSMSVGTDGSLDFTNASLLPFRGDWNADEQSSIRTAVRGSAPNRQYVVEWHDIRHQADPNNRVTVQAILDEAGGFSYVYPDTDTSYLRTGGMATIGLRAKDGTTALIYADRLTTLRPGFGLRIEPTPTA